MKKANVKTTGKKKGKILKQYAMTYPKRKLSHLLKHNTLKEAEEWAAAHKAEAILERLLRPAR